MAVSVDGPEVLVAEGTRADGVSWRICTQRHPPGADFPDEDEVESTIRIAARMAGRCMAAVLAGPRCRRASSWASAPAAVTKARAPCCPMCILSSGELS
jgi:hypothetical protein